MKSRIKNIILASCILGLFLFSPEFIHSQQVEVFSDIIGLLSYETTDHRNNIYNMTSDQKLFIPSISSFNSDVVSFADYYAYGMLLPDRNESLGDSRFGFQGQEMDDEVKGEGNSINYTYRMYDPRVGRFFAVDPLAKKNNFLSPYSAFDNTPIWKIDPTGGDADVTIDPKTNTVTISLDILVYGVTAEKAEEIQEIIIANWGDNWYETWTYYDEIVDETYSIKFDVNVEAFNIFKMNKAQNIVIFSDGENQWAHRDEAGNLRSCVIGGNFGVWEVLASLSTIVHEFGHFIGLKDRYSDKVTKVIVDGEEKKMVSGDVHDGWKGNVMGESDGKIQQKNIDALVAPILEESISIRAINKELKEKGIEDLIPIEDVSIKGNPEW